MPLFCKKEEPWMTEYKQYNKKYVNKNFSHNLIMSQHAMLDIYANNHFNNRHVCVLGDIDELERYVLANILQANCNYVIPDATGELYELTGDFLRNQGYDVQVIDFSSLNHGARYNPLQNLGPHKEVAIVELIQLLFQNTVGDHTTEKDRKLLFAMISHVLTLSQEQQNLATVYNMLNTAHEQQDYNTIESLAHETFSKIPNKKFAWTNHADEPLEESVRRVRDKLSAFFYKDIVALTSDDTLSLNELHHGKRAVFIIDRYCCNELQVILYNQILRHCEMTPEGATRPLMVFLPKAVPELEQRLRYLYKQKTHVALLYPSIASIKRDHPEDWDGVICACDNLLYFGGHGYETLEYISKQLGYRPFDERAIRRHYRSHKSINYGIVRRELLTPDEIANLAANQCIAIVHHEKPFLDTQYSIQTHPNFQYLSNTALRGYYEKS